MSILTPQDLGSSLSVLEYLKNYAVLNSNTDMEAIVTELLSEYNNVMVEPDESDKTLLPYNRKDAYSILEYLKLQAEQLSEGRWTDFSDSDIGTVYLKLMSYLADMNNFQVDKSISELYLDTCTERASAIALANLIGYEPRHFQSAYTDVVFTNVINKEVANGTKIPKYTTVTDSNSLVRYCSLEDFYMFDNYCKIRMYEGTPVTRTYTISDISSLGRINLQDYAIGTNTIKLIVDGIEFTKVDDVRFISGTLGFSVHITTDKYLYIQLPSYWSDIITQGSSIEIKYLISSGIEGRVGKNVLNKIEQLDSEYKSNITIQSNTASYGGYNPETTDEMKVSIPRHARTMNTIVTINDFEEVSLNVLGISDVSALDYNDPSSGLIQPDDYYKVYMYVLPDAESYDPTDEESLKYRNTIIKDISDWTLEDMEKVAEGMDSYAKNSVTGNSIILNDVTNVYGVNDIVPAILSNTEEESYVIERVTSVGDISDRLVCSVTVSGTNIIVTLNSNWRDFVDDSEKIAIYYKKEQILTDKGQVLREYIDERRLTSLNVTYHDLDIVQPDISVDVYMSKDNINFQTASTQVKDFIFKKYSRPNLKIGEPIFASVIGADILNAFDWIRYCEVRTPEEKIEVLPKGFIDVVPSIMVNGVLVDKITVNVYDYQNKTS